MTSDDDRISYLSGDAAGPVDDTDRADLDELRAFLADPSLWAEPNSELEDAVVAAVSSEANAPASTVPLTPARRRRPLLLRPGSLIGAAAAAAALVVVLILGLGGDAEQAQFAASLQATDLAPGAEGRATFTRTDSGWRIELDAVGLARLDGGRFYQAWLRNDAGVLVAIGTFNEPDDVVLWAGVSPVDYPTITVTEEAADDDSASSGRRVLVGPITDR